MKTIGWDINTVESIIAMLDEDIDSPAFLEPEKGDINIEYAKGYYNALVEFRDELQEYIEQEVSRAESQLNEGGY